MRTKLNATIAILTLMVLSISCQKKVSFMVNTTASGNGTVVINPAKTTFGENEQVIITATPHDGNAFTGWSGSASGTTNPYLIQNITKDYNIVANLIVLLINHFHG